MLLSLDDVYTIDALQIWNFNTTGPGGADLTKYGPTSFDIWVSDVDPTTNPGSLRLLADDVPLPRAVFGDPDYQGETFLLSAGTANLVASELGDETGGPTTVIDPLTNRPLMVTGRTMERLSA